MSARKANTKSSKPPGLQEQLPGPQIVKAKPSNLPGVSTAKRVPTGQRLSDSETRYRRLFEAAQDGILILDAKTGFITDVNPFLMKLLDYFREEFLGKALWRIG